jgi:hypothetical protein
MQKLVAQDPKNGAYTELFAGLDESITQKDNGGWGTYLRSLFFTYFLQVSWGLNIGKF